MIATPEQRKAFGDALRQVRVERGLTVKDVRDLLETGGEDVTQQAVGGWERGEYAPKRLRTIHILEAVLKARGRLTQHLGLTPEDDESITLSASGADLDELAELDPETYAHLMDLARLALDRARTRRPAE